MHRLRIDIMQAVLCSALGIWALDAAAQVAPRGGVQESLRDVRPADPMRCGLEQQKNSVAPKEAAARRLPDFKCSVQPRAAWGAVQSGKGFLVDTRSSVEFERFRVDGSINLDASALMQRRSWLSRPLVLMNEGDADEDLYAACASLKSKGFKDVRVVNGGWHAWLVEGLPYVGDAPRVTRIQFIDDRALMRRQAASDTLLLIAPSMHTFVDLLSSARLLEDASPAAIKQAVEQRRRSGGVLQALVYLGPLAELEAAAGQLGPLRLLQYPGSDSQFRHYSTALARSWARQAAGPGQLPCQLL